MESYLALCSYVVFGSYLALRSPRLGVGGGGESELVYMLLVHLFVCLACVNFSYPTFDIPYLLRLDTSFIMDVNGQLRFKV